MPGFKLSEDYVMVNERIMAFYEKYPEGSIQSEIFQLTDDQVVIKAFAYRNPDDDKPGIGHSALTIPGKTPYTKDSEIENAETSAWGRALAALGFEVKRGIASSEEVKNKAEIADSDIPGVERGGRTAKASSIQIKRLSVLSQELGLGVRGIRDAIEASLGDAIKLPDDDQLATDNLKVYLGEMSREDIGTLITHIENTHPEPIYEADEPE